ncbi:hypothetical protein [Gluconacetobacter tumulisoli]|uniref:Uncharacterized protein n=1 Tax=Gluconacetobacter tumulisoli TaxID=1286189 RepID=A0A7W4PMC0_9PROT|nr:hypothetical protein [Gluconacetobacter tumulisoli]MBB2203020.1 hypothetical protein [Gluconacetobacter tumulisoli]
MLDIRTYDAQAGGNVLYKALAHPLAAEALSSLAAELRAQGPVAVYDPDGMFAMVRALGPDFGRVEGLYVHDVALVGQPTPCGPARALTDLAAAPAAVVLAASFDGARIHDRIAHLLPPGARFLSLDSLRLADGMLTVRDRYLDRLNFATNHAFFRDQDRLSTRLVSANYWSRYGARGVRLWLRLFDADGRVLATWEEDVADDGGSIVIDSRAVRARFGLPAFTGQLFIHAIGVAGHDVVKYALDTYGTDGNDSLSVTHDANAWPSDRYANLPAPDAEEDVVLWVQNSHAVPIPAGAMSLNRMGEDRHVPIMCEIGPYQTAAIRVADCLPDLAWPAQIEFRSGRHVVRPRYEVISARRTRIAHLNVERADLRPDPGIANLPDSLGRGYLLPFPILDPARFRTIVQPVPMAESQVTLPLRLDCFDGAGRPTGQKFLGRLRRDHDLALDLAELGVPEGHAELVYDFRDGGEADGWLHALVRFQARDSGHAAETSFGAHIFNTVMTYRGEPQSYSGPPPGLTTRLFLKGGNGLGNAFCCLIYPASAAWRPQSRTVLTLHDRAGRSIAESRLDIACSGSGMVWPHRLFGATAVEQAGIGGYVMIRDTTCRLFGYHGVMRDAGGFSLDHMFGF